jgi:hypothetical protein
MNHTIDINEIVREVLRRLKDATTAEPTSQAVTNDPGELTVPDRVVTMGTLAGWLNGVTTLLVRPDAVVTPLVVEELKRRKIQIRRGAGSTAGRQQQQLLLATAGTGFHAGILQQRLNNTPLQIIRHDSDDVPTAVEKLATGITGNELAILATQQTASALIHLNRHSHLRAIDARDLKQTQQDIQQVEANVLVFHPGRWTIDELENLARMFTCVSQK